MYTPLRQGLHGVPQSVRLAPRHLVGSDVSPTVVRLGFTSLFTDISSEMISTILPLYLVFYLRLSPIQYGLIDGVYQGASALVRVFGGYAADRWRRYKEVAGFGYLLSAITRPAMLAVGGSWTAIAAVILIDRTGKGIRTAPRDALISLNSPPDRLGAAFGVHRTLDTLGALLGPLLAFLILSRLTNAFDVVFVVSFCMALIGFSILALFVENRTSTTIVRHRQPVSWSSAFRLLEARTFRRLVVAGSALALATISDGFLYLELQRRLTFQAAFIPLLYVLTSLSYLVLAVPVGRLADRVGRRVVFLSGYVLLLLVNASLLLPSVGAVGLFACLACFGAYYAATDGVLMAFASELLAPELRTSGLAVLTTATGLAGLFASLLFGAAWTAWGPDAAARLFAVGLLLALAFSIWCLIRPRYEGALVGVNEPA